MTVDYDTLERSVPVGALIALDASTTLAYLVGTEPVSPVATWIFDGCISTSRNPAVLSTITAAELLVRPFRAGETALATVEGFLRFFTSMQLAEVTYPIARTAAGMRAVTGLALPDAIVIATAIEHGARCRGHERSPVAVVRRRSGRSRHPGPAPRRVRDAVSDPGQGSTRLALLAGIAAPIISWGLSVTVIAGWPGYDPVSESISLLANAPLGWLQTLAFAISGVLGAAFALGLARVLGSTGRDRSRVRALLLLLAALALGFAIFPTDADGRGMSTVGKVHLGIFYAYAIAMPVTLLLVGRVMGRDPRWLAAARPTLIAGALVIVSSVLVPLTLDGPLTPWLGILERIYVAIPSLWQVGAGIVGWRVAASFPVR